MSEYQDKDTRISLRATPQEAAEMDAAAAARGMSRSEYLRSCALAGADQNAYLTGQDRHQITTLIHQTRAVGRNLNVLVRQLNTGGRVAERVTPDQVAKTCREIEVLLVAPIAAFIDLRLPKVGLVDPAGQSDDPLRSDQKRLTAAPPVASSQERFSNPGGRGIVRRGPPDPRTPKPGT